MDSENKQETLTGLSEETAGLKEELTTENGGKRDEVPAPGTAENSGKKEGVPAPGTAENSGKKDESPAPGTAENSGKKDDIPAPGTVQEPESEEPGEKFDWRKELRDWAIIIVAAFALAYAITHFVIIKTEVISGSMIATLNVDDRVVANRLSYVFSDPKRGDIIFFAFPDDESKTYVKRIIGLPGETVEIIDGKIYIDGADEPLDEPYLHEKPEKEDSGPYVVPENSYFVMGDNRNVSIDSRYWKNKFVRKDQIYGKAWFRYSPNISLVKGAEYE